MSGDGSLRILLLAPHPFYQERGTPIAVDLLLRALSADGHQVDVVTFPEGQERRYPNVTVHRVEPWFRTTGIRPGFSLKKLFCDGFLFARGIGLLRRNRYDVVHAVEESGFFALVYRRFFRVPFIYDMDSLMSAQLADKYPRLAAMRGLMERLERLPMRHALAVAPMCEELADQARGVRGGGVVVIKDVSLIDDSREAEGADLDGMAGIERPVIMYIGNLEPYQGMDLLLSACARLARPYSLVVIGGLAQDIEAYRARARELGIADSVHFLGPRPVDHIGTYLRQADILVSPRVHGTNTPMKIYSYLSSGVPVVATDLPTHTQVLNRDIAVLAQPDADAFAAALRTLLDNEELRQRIGARAAAYAAREHSMESFVANVRQLYRYVGQQLCNGS